MLHLTRIVAIAAAALAGIVSGCGAEQKPETTTAVRERADRPAQPPPGWRTVRNRFAGFTVAVPDTWTATGTRRRTAIRSDDRLVAISISADRSARGRRLSARRYARRTIRTVPHFAGIIDRRVTRVRGAKYESAVVTATGTVEPSNYSQRISVAVFHLPGRVSYGALVFRNAGVKPGFNDRKIDSILRSFRAQPARNR